MSDLRKQFESSGLESSFRSWYDAWRNRTAVNGQMLDANPDAPEHQYDYRRAFASGVEPSPPSDDQYWHWPSMDGNSNWLKMEGHPTRHMERGVLGGLIK